MKWPGVKTRIDPDTPFGSSVLSRRLRTIPALVGGAVVGIVGLPLWVTLAVAVDVFGWLARGKRAVATRLVLFGVFYLWAEVAGLAAAGWVVVASRDKATVALQTRRIQLVWATQLIKAVRRIFALEFRVSGAECVIPGPILVLARHASVVDNLLPAALITAPTGIALRYVLKKELLADPALDVVGNRLPNAFVDRAGDSSESKDAIAGLATDLGAGDGVLLFPEGTRFSPQKLRRAVRSLKRRNPRIYPLAAGFRSVLPPRTGGVLALLGASDADVVVLAHRGLEGFASVRDIWKGALVGKTVDVHLWRVSAAEIPNDRAGRVEWLFRTWQEVDDWIDRGGPPEARHDG